MIKFGMTIYIDMFGTNAEDAEKQVAKILSLNMNKIMKCVTIDCKKATNVKCDDYGVVTFSVPGKFDEEKALA